MDILFACSQCGKRCCVGAASVGKQFPCPDCGNTLVAPEPQIVFACPACQSIYCCPSDLALTEFLCPSCEETITIPEQAELLCRSCGIMLELDLGYYGKVEGGRLECPECHYSLSVPQRPRLTKVAPSAHPPGFGHKTLRLDTILESIPQADQLREGRCPFCGHEVERYNERSYTCSNCSRQITMTHPTIKRGDPVEE